LPQGGRRRCATAFEISPTKSTLHSSGFARLDLERFTKPSGWGCHDVSRIKGTFKFGRSGHFGQYPSELIEIQFIKPLAFNHDEAFKYFHLKLKGVLETSSGFKALVIDNQVRSYTVKEGTLFAGIGPKSVKKCKKTNLLLKKN